MARKKRHGKEVSLVCLSCRKKFGGLMYSKTEVKSQGLTQHITRSASNKCMKYYSNYNLLKSDRSIDLHTSLYVPIRTPSNKKPRITTGAINYANPIDEDDFPQSSLINRSLNSQTLYRPGVPLDREHVSALLDHALEKGATTSPLDEMIEGGEETENFQRRVYCEDDSESDSDYDEDYGINVPDNFVHFDDPLDNNIPQGPPDGSFSISPLPPPLLPGPQLLAEIELMNLMVQHKMPLTTFHSIFNWAINAEKRDGFSFSDLANPRKRATVLKETQKCIGIPVNAFKTVTVNWRPSNKPVQLYIRSFRHTLNSLLTNSNLVKEQNFSFPHPSVPYIGKNFPKPAADTEISELHHGSWWVDSWKQNCTLTDVDVYDESIDHSEQGDYKEILVPIILYMDGISLDAHGRLTLTPLNFTLGIFNIEARKQPEAWETLYFHPCTNVVEISQGSEKAKSFHKAQNLHNSLDTALKSFFEECQCSDGVLWDDLPYGGKKWKVKMKFAIAYVVGDTELHNKLCGHYCNFNTSAPEGRICRHCNCLNGDLVVPAKQGDCYLYEPSHFEDLNMSPEHFRSNSHHPVKNAFYKLDFGANRWNIHLATPAELLHMHQLGCAKRAVEAFKDLLEGKTYETTGRRKGQAVQNVTSIAQLYGSQLSRQSDRNFPRTKFSSTYIISTTMKEGKDYAAILLCIILTLVSAVGQFNCKERTSIDDDTLQRQIETLELILGMEEFLKHGRMKVEDIPKLRRLSEVLIQKVVDNCPRKDGNGTNLIKNHLHFHLHQYISLWGHPSGWDSSWSESHHKTQIKAPSKNTQQHATTLIKQVGIRQTELRTIEFAMRAFKLQNSISPTIGPSSLSKLGMYGAQFRVNKDNNGSPRMEWSDSRYQHKPTHPDEVLKFICDTILPLVEEDSLEGCTEHHREDLANEKKYIWRAHPSYRTDSGQCDGLWYDWAVFDLDGKNIPCHILCFLRLERVKPNRRVRNFPVHGSGLFAVVRRFKEEPLDTYEGLHSHFIRKGTLDNRMFLFDCETILEDVAVVPDFHTRPEGNQPYTLSQTGANFFVVANKHDWLEWFQNQMEVDQH